MLISTAVALIVGTFVRKKKLGERFASSFGLKAGTLPFSLVESLVPSVILNTCNTMVMCGINILMNPSVPGPVKLSLWVRSCLASWPIMFVISYFAAFFAQKIAVKIAMTFCPPPSGGPGKPENHP